MARSADLRAPARRVMVAGLLVAAAAVLGGCMTTQDEAARLQLNASRIRTGEAHTIVRARGDAVRVVGFSVLRAPATSTFVVTARNLRDAAVADLPISVGIRRHHGRRVYLNAHSAAELSYFDAHLPVIAANGTLTWVYVVRRSLPRGARPFVIVGGRPAPAVQVQPAVPAIRAKVTGQRMSGPRGASLAVAVHDASAVPQYQLQVYAVARRAGRVVAAGAVTVPHLGSHRTEAVSLPVTGRPTGARFDVVALPTIFQ